LTEKLLRAEDVGRILGVSRAGAYNLAKSGVIKYVAFRSKGNRDTIRFREEDLASFIRGHLCDGRDRSATEAKA
jgi:predicted site-specific integrase-resolvase